MNSMFLNTDELAALTGRVRASAQIRALRAMGIEHRIRPNGRPAVLRMHIEQTLGAKTPSMKPRGGEPNWSAA